jgi:hypothetical protein
VSCNARKPPISSTDISGGHLERRCRGQAPRTTRPRFGVISTLIDALHQVRVSLVRARHALLAIPRVPIACGVSLFATDVCSVLVCPYQRMPFSWYMPLFVFSQTT